MTLAACRSCHALIVWVEMRSGERMPLDRDATPDGTIRESTNDRGFRFFEVLTGGDLEAAHESGVPLYRSHFATCPDAAEWRRTTQRRGQRPKKGAS